MIKMAVADNRKGFVEPQAFDVPGASEYRVASNMVRNRIFYSEIQSIEKNGNTQLISRYKIFHVYKVFVFDILKQFDIRSSIKFSLIRYPVFRLRRVCFYQQSIFVLYFLLSVRYSAWRTAK